MPLDLTNTALWNFDNNNGDWINYPRTPSSYATWAALVASIPGGHYFFYTTDNSDTGDHYLTSLKHGGAPVAGDLYSIDNTGSSIFPTVDAGNFSSLTSLVSSLNFGLAYNYYWYVSFGLRTTNDVSNGDLARIKNSALVIGDSFQHDNRPTASFTYEVDPVTNTVHFTDTSTNDVTSWSWDFGDFSGTSTSKNPTYTYANPGGYVITLLVANQWDNDQISVNILVHYRNNGNYYIVQDLQSYIDFTTNVTDGVAPLSILFKPLILTTLKPVSYLWEFGDGTRSTSITPTHIYTIGGDITPTLTVTFEDNSQSILSKQNFLRIFKVQIIPTESKGLAPLTTELDTYFDLPRNVSITSYTWSFGDTYSSTGINPVHTYTKPGIYSGSLLNGFAGLGFSGIQSYPFSSSFSITSITPSIKYSDMFTCLGWIRNPVTADQTSLIPLAIADQYNNVINTSLSIKFEIFRDGNDYRILYSGSKSKLIGKNIKVALNDGSWHCVGYECDSSGNMTFYIDGLIVPAEDGKGSDGIAYNKARSVNSRLGSGPVWAPYLYALNQSIELYNWRYGKNFNLGQSWINQLIDVDEVYLNG